MVKKRKSIPLFSGIKEGHILFVHTYFTNVGVAVLVLVHCFKMVVISVLGLGRLGGNIAGDLAFNGHTVRTWDNDKNALDKLHERLAYEKKRLKEDKLLVHPQFLVKSAFLTF